MDISLIWMEDEDGQHASSPLELEYRTVEGKLFFVNPTLSVGSNLDRLTTHRALGVKCLSGSTPRAALLKR